MSLLHGHIPSRDCWCNPSVIEMGQPLTLRSSAVFACWHALPEDSRRGLLHEGELAPISQDDDVDQKI